MPAIEDQITTPPAGIMPVMQVTEAQRASILVPHDHLHTGVLKSEDPQAFFGPWLAAHGVGFTDAVLIDDRADNCAAFTRESRAAIQWKIGTNDLSDVTDQLRQWLNHDARDTRDEEFSVMHSAVVAS
jgi:hypothetical protein